MDALGRYSTLMARLESLGNPENVRGMARFGINTETAWGISMPALRSIAKDLGKDHDLALRLWKSGRHEARILASLVDDPKQVTPEQMEAWVAGFDSWDVCDQACSNLFDRTPHATGKAVAWAGREEEYVKRAAFVLMAALAVHDKKSPDKVFLDFLPLIRREAEDPRNFVRKAVNWALRQIGKRNRVLNQAAIVLAEDLAGKPASRWVGSDALRELRSEGVQARLGKRVG